MTYPGGKNGAGVYQAIICQIPPHQVYVEPFLGSGAVMRLKDAEPLPFQMIGHQGGDIFLIVYDKDLHTFPSSLVGSASRLPCSA